MSNISRAALRKFLCVHIEAHKKSTATEASGTLLKALEEAVLGLDILELGEIPPIFMPKKVAAWGKHPARAKMLQARAVGYVKLLQALKMTRKKALEEVSSAYLVTASAVRHWEKSAPGTDPSLETWRRMPTVQHERYKKWKLATQFDAVLLHLEVAGKSFLAAREKKSVPKSKG